MNTQTAGREVPIVVAEPRARPFRKDIQGLRALAVLLVVCSHVVGWPEAGFVGVDVFFVISGFLITGTLLESEGRPWREVMTRFYLHRVRRILPAAVTTLVVTAVVARLVLSSARADRVATDAAWSGGFAANWHFMDVRTDYFGSSIPASPLQHFWSLAVEEQFYLVWPLALGLVVFATRTRWRGTLRSTALLLAGVVVLASFAWACWQGSTEPLAAYFSTLTRVWEVAVGAGLACLSPFFAKLPDRLREAVAFTSLAGIVGGAILMSERAPFPGPGAALPVLATAFFIAAGTATTRPLRAHRALTSAPALHLGAMSYSVYLWHWPALVLVGAVVAADGWPLVVITLLVTLALSEATYHLVERPFLRPRTTGVRPRRWRWALIATAAAVAVLAVVSGQRLVSAPSSNAAAATTAPQLSTPPATSDPVAALTASLHEEIVASLGAADFPALTPPLDRPAEGVAPEMEAAAKCLNPPDPTDTSACTFAPDRTGRGLVVVLGDSVALSWLPGVREALAADGYSVHAVTFSNCPPALVGVRLDSQAWTDACSTGLAAALGQVRRLKPTLVVGSAFQNALRTVVPTSATPNAQDAYVKGLVDVGRQVRAAGARFVLLGPPPAGPSPLDCGGRFQQPSDCVTSPQGDFEATLSAFASAAAQGQFGFINTEPWFCVEIQCPGFAAGHLVRWDNAHLTDQFARYLAPLLRETLSPEIAARGQ